MEITAKMVADLRAQTGSGMMDCKKALKEADGDFDAAIKILREKGISVAAKKADRIAAEGLVDILSENGVTAMIEVNSETDFVAKNEEFKKFVRGLLATIIACRPADVEALKACKFNGGDNTVADELVEKIATIKENMTIRRFVIVDGTVSTYIHGNGATGVIVLFDADDAAKNAEGFGEYAKNIALQVAGMNPIYALKADVPQSVIDEEKEIRLTQIKNDPKNASKPEAIIEKMINGAIEKYYSQNVLTEQEYFKEEKMTIQQYTDNSAKAFGGKIAIKAFWCFNKGEGLQKREDNFAEEIASLIK